MSTIIKKSIFSLVLCYLIVPISFLFIQKELSTRSLSDAYFLISLVFLIIGAFIAIMSSGFFDRFQKQMKELFAGRRKKDVDEYIALSDIFSRKPYYWFLTGGVLLLTSLILVVLT